MNAGRLLRKSGYDTEALRVRIAPVDPDRINVWPASPFFRRFWRHGVRGVTQGRLIFVDPALMRDEGDRLARLVIHELVHVRQYVASGYLRFLTAYIKDYWKGRIGGLSPEDAYRGIAHEREARELTERTVSAV